MSVLENPPRLVFAPEPDENFDSLEIRIPYLKDDQAETAFGKFVNDQVREACGLSVCPGKVFLSSKGRLASGHTREIIGASIQCAKNSCPLKDQADVGVRLYEDKKK